MANLLDETQGPINDNGRDVHVIDRQLPVEITFKSTLFEIALWVTIPVLTLLFVLAMGSQLQDPGLVAICGCVGGLLLGKTFGTRLAGKASILGGVILILIGLEIFITGVFA